MKVSYFAKSSLQSPIKPAAGFTGQQPFEIGELRDLLTDGYPGSLYANRQEKYHIIWVKKGSGEHLIDTRKLKLKDNMVYFITPKQLQVLNADTTIEGSVISFTADFLGLTSTNFDPLFRDGLFSTGTAPAVINVTDELRNDLSYIMFNLQKEFLNYSALKEEILREYLKVFLIHLTRRISQSMGKEQEQQLSGTELADKFFNLLQKNFTTKKLVTDYAAMLSVSANYLNVTVKKISGYPASHHIHQQIIQEAKRQAVYTDKSMKEIAYLLGFEAITHFSKFFKKNEGNNFSLYRKNTCQVMYA
jgi:AraC family transcriptional activator of pobA